MDNHHRRRMFPATIEFVPPNRKTKCPNKARSEKWPATDLFELVSNGAVVDIAEYIYYSIGNRIAMRVTGGERVKWSYDNACKLDKVHRLGQVIIRRLLSTPLEPSGEGRRGYAPHPCSMPANLFQTSRDAMVVANYTIDANGIQ